MTMISLWEIEMVAAFRSEVRNLAFRTPTPPWETFEDIENQMMLAIVQACRKWAADNPDRPPKKYIRGAIWTIRKNLCRKAGRRVDDILINDVVDDDATYAQPEAYADQAIRVAALDASKLEAQRLVAVLAESDIQHFDLLQRHAEGYEYKEIAEDLNEPVGAVRGRMSRARTKCRDIIEERTNTKW